MADSHKETNRPRGSIVGGLILIGIGGFFLLVQMGWLPFIVDSWPVILIIVGVALLIGGLGKPRAKRDESAP